MDTASRAVAGGGNAELASKRRPSRIAARRAPRLILLVDRRPLTREGVARCIEAKCRDVRVLAVADPAELFGADPVDEEEPGLVLLNIAGAAIDEPHVVEAIEALKRVRPGIPVIVLSDQQEFGAIITAIDLGLRGYIPTSLDLNLVVEALRFVEAGGTFVPTDLLLECTRQLRTIQEQHPPEADDRLTEADDLTPREREVLALMQQGRANKIIAHELHMQESTVKVHVRHILHKLKATNRTEAALRARANTAGEHGGGHDPRWDEPAEVVALKSPPGSRRG